MTMTEAPPIPDVSAEAPIEARSGGSVILLGIGLVWLTALLWSMRAAGADYSDPDSVLVVTAQNLFGPVTAALATGCAAGLAATTLLRGRLSRLVLRIAVGAAAGLACGLATGGLTLFMIKDNRAAVVVGLCLVASATLGGLLNVTVPGRALAAGIAGTYATFAVRVLFSLFSDRLTSIFGAGKTIDSVVAAQGRLALGTSLLAGLAAGAVAYRYLQRSTGPRIGWPGFLVAGALSGLLALVAEIFTRVTASKLLALVTELSVLERAALSLTGTARINGALVVLFAGGVTGMILIGRTLKPATSASPAPTSTTYDVAVPHSETVRPPD
jgi:hypothetical protein